MPSRTIAVVACTTSEENSTSTARRSVGTLTTVGKPAPLNQTARHRLAPDTTCSSSALELT